MPNKFNSLISVENVSFVYENNSKNNPSKFELKNLNFTLAKNEVVVVFGRNGSGKSTFINLLAGFLSPLFGKINCAGGSRANFGIVFQDVGLFDWKTVFENVNLALLNSNLSISKKEKLVFDALDLLGVKSQQGKYPKELSGGQKQRTAIARALVSSPSVLLLDEPFSALDWSAKTDLFFELRGIIQRKGLSVVMVTHSIDEALFFADRLVIWDKGIVGVEKPCVGNKNNPLVFSSKKFVSEKARILKKFGF